MSWQEPPPPPQIRHWYWKVIGAEPRDVPGFAVTVLPTATSPLIVGAEALEGAAEDVLVTADAAEAATRTATAANTGARRKRFMVETSVAGCAENSRCISGQNAVLRTVHRLLHTVHRRKAGRQQDAAVSEDGHRLVEAEARGPLGPCLPHRKGGGGVGVGGRELGADDRHRQHAGRRAAGVGVDDVLAARVRTRRRDGHVVSLDHGGDLVALERMLDPDPPAWLRERRAAQPDVAAGVERVVARPGRVEQIARTIDRPPLHEPRRIRSPLDHTPGVEVAVGDDAQLVAACEHLAH